MKVEINGVNFDSIKLNEVIKRIEFAVKQGDKGKIITTVNTDILLMSKVDQELKMIIETSWLTTADGMPIVWLSKLYNRSLPERVTGADITRELCFESPRRGFKLFFLGAKPGVAEQAKIKMEAMVSGVDIVGVYSPSSSELIDNDLSMQVVRLINKSGANILLVALGAPKQEKWIYKYREYLDTSVLIGVGASIDFLSGNIKRAPKWIQGLGVEWAFRLCQDPKRLWKRYLRDFLFLKVAVLEIYKSLVRK